MIAGGLNNSLMDILSLNTSARAIYLGDRYHEELPNIYPHKPQNQMIMHAFGPNSPRILDTIPGIRRTVSSGSNSYHPKRSSIGGDQHNATFDFLMSRCWLNSSHIGVRFKYVNGTKLQVPIWQQNLAVCGRLGHRMNTTWRFVLAELLQVRIYQDDKARWTINELKQWVHYMFLAGVEHIFICDHFHLESERLDVELKRYMDYGLVTYIPWSNIRNPMQAQIQCYQYIIDNYKQHTRWQMAVDIDEYPFTSRDHTEGFLVRYLRNTTRQYGTRISEISMSNFLMLGQGDRSRDLVIERINRITPKPANVLVKPMYLPERVRANIHHNHLMFGNHINADNDALRMLHYWGARVQDWGPDTNCTLTITREMNTMRDKWGEKVRNSLLTFGEYGAFSNSTGP